MNIMEFKSKDFFSFIFIYSEASLHEFLDNLYSGQHPQQQQQNTSAYAGSSRRRNRRN